MKVQKLFIQDPLNAEAAALMAIAKDNCKDTLRKLHQQGLLPSLQAFILAVTQGHGMVEVDGDVVEIPPHAMQEIGALANYALSSLMVEMARDANAQMN